jgi:hypothetical protein
MAALPTLISPSALASAEVLFDSLGGATEGALASVVGSMDATFATGASTFDATDIALNIGQTRGGDPNRSLL